MRHSLDDTIAAPASAPGAGRRAIIRVSGRRARDVVDACFEPSDSTRWSAATRPERHPGRLRPEGFDQSLDGSVWFWPGTRSYAGEPLAELHLPGSPPVVAGLLAALYAAGARPAQPGEFTLRAFLSGRIDLVQAEAVQGVIEAEDHRQLRAALSQLAGGISRPITDLREELLLHLADLEAGLDFVEEGLEFVDRAALAARLQAGLEAVDRLRQMAADRLQSTGRRRVVLAGLPNAGKSTLFNALAQRDAALVSPQPGTTRDALTALVNWHGSELELVDTAGWDVAREADSALEQAAGLQRGEMLGRADLILWCAAADLERESQQADRARRADLADNAPVLEVITKHDVCPPLCGHPAAQDAASPSFAEPALAEQALTERRIANRREAALPHVGRPPLAVSARTGAGLPELRRAIVERLRAADSASGELLQSTAARCQESLRAAAEALRSARDAALSSAGDELIAIDLRQGLDALGLICGEVYADDLLDRIFSRFCIGK